jgi:putative lipoic acid-binding regulatory protein
VTRQFGELAPDRIEERPSSTGRYLSLTCTVHATSKAQLDAVYAALTSCRQVLVAL